MNLARGFDVSHWNTPTRQNFADWRSLGFCICIINVAIGKARDPLQHKHRENLLATGYMTAPYQALHEAADPEEQAQILVELRADEDIELHVADLERPALTDQMILRFLHEYDKLTTMPLWIYTNQSRWHQYFKTRAAREFAAQGRELFVAGYPFDRSDWIKNANGVMVWQGQLMDERSVALRSNPPVNKTPLFPDGWNKYVAWQHTGHGRVPGYNKDLDMAIYAVTETELRAKFQKTTEPAPSAPVIESESKMIHLFIPNNLSDETMRAVTEHLDALAKDVTARGEVYPYGPPNQVAWYELWPNGVLAVPRKLRAANPCTLYSTPNGQVLRTITDSRLLDVYERRDDWFRVLQATDITIWVHASQVVTL